VDNQPVTPGEISRVAFKAKNFINLLGYQFALHFDPQALQLEDIEAGDLTNLTEHNFGLTMLEEGIITTSWDNSKNTLHDDNTVLFTLVFRAKNKASLSDLLHIQSGATMLAEAYQNTEDKGIELLDVNLAFNDPQATGAADTVFELLQNNPNPFREETVIGFRLPDASSAKLSVYDLSGKILKVVSGNFSKGYNEIILKEKELGSSGILFYQLETPTHTATRRMVRL
jgi:hypothetical protein